MNSNIIGIYEDLGATARARTEAIAAQGLFVSGVMEQGYRLWMTLVSTEVTEAMRVAQELSSCKTPVEIAEIQTRWLQATSARAITSLQGTIEIANFLISNLQGGLAAVAPPTVSGAPKVLSAPRALAAPVVAAPAPAPVVAAPVVAAPAPAPVVAAPAVAAPAPAPVVAAPAVAAPAPVVAAPAVAAPAPVVAAPAVAAPAPAPVVAAPVVAAPAPKGKSHKR